MEALHSPYKVYVPQLLVFTILTGKKKSLSILVFDVPRLLYLPKNNLHNICAQSSILRLFQ